MKSRSLVAFVVAVLFSAMQAQGALFLGNTVRLTYETPLGSPTITANVLVTNPGVEAKFGPFNIDLSDDSIRIGPDFNTGTYTFPATFSGIVINDVLGVLPAFTSVTIDPTSTVVTPVVTFNANSIFVNLSNVSFPAASGFQFIRLNVIAAIPEPATASLGLVGLAGLMLRRRRVA